MKNTARYCLPRGFLYFALLFGGRGFFLKFTSFAGMVSFFVRPFFCGRFFLTENPKSPIFFPSAK